MPHSVQTNASTWQTLPDAWAPTPVVLRETLDGGQAFRWREVAPGTWKGQWSQHVVELHLPPDRPLQWRTRSEPDPATATAVCTYLAADHDWVGRADRLPWRSDPHLARAMAAFPGLRLLRQPFGETLLAFLCSATKQIVQIKQMLALLAARHGRPTCNVLRYKSAETTCDHPVNNPVAGHYHGLPDWASLAALPEEALRACQLGFRARHIKAVAARLAADPGWLETTATAPYAEAKARLLTLPGVGEKVADCVLLFGGGHLEAFPVDTWIIKAMQRHYGLEAWAPAQVAHFGRQHFGPAAGLAQQYLFAWERAHRASQSKT